MPMVQFEIVGNNNHFTTIGDDPDTYSYGHIVHQTLKDALDVLTL